MTICPILPLSDPSLRQRAQPVDDTGQVGGLVQDLLDTLYANPKAVGVAATQIGVPVAVLVVDISDQRDSPLVLINPQLLASRGLQRNREGCLSVPGYRAAVTRADEVEVKALDRCGQPCIIQASGYLAAAIQHEMDHLAGQVFLDRLPRWRQRWVYWRHPAWLRSGPPG